MESLDQINRDNYNNPKTCLTNRDKLMKASECHSQGIINIPYLNPDMLVIDDTNSQNESASLNFSPDRSEEELGFSNGLLPSKLDRFKNGFSYEWTDYEPEKEWLTNYEPPNLVTYKEFDGPPTNAEYETISSILFNQLKEYSRCVFEFIFSIFSMLEISLLLVMIHCLRK